MFLNAIIILSIILIFFIFILPLIIWISISSKIDYVQDVLKQLTLKVFDLEKKYTQMVPKESGDFKESPVQPSPFESALIKPSAIPEVINTPVHPPKGSPSTPSESDFEQQVGGRISVWIGGVALTFAGLYLIQYSIETGLLTPFVRLILSGLFGLTLIGGAQHIWARKNIANQDHIVQSLSGAGIAIMYFTFYAASSLYDFLPPLLGFIGMACVTATAVLLSLLHGFPIAILGLLGGFLTPILLGGNEPHAPSLFAYLYLVSFGLLVVCRQKRWWWLALPTLGLGFMWVLAWLFGIVCLPLPGDTITLSIFVLAICGTTVWSTGSYNSSAPLDFSESKNLKGLNLLSMGLSIVLMATIGIVGHLGLWEWALYTLLCCGGVGLAFVNIESYSWAPILSLPISILMIMGGPEYSPLNYVLLLLILWAIHGLSALILSWISKNNIFWALLGSASSLVYFLLAYFPYGHVPRITLIDSDFFWPAFALGCAAVFVLLANKVIKKIRLTEERNYLVVINAITLTSFISIGLAIILPTKFWPLALACQFAASGWIYNQIPIPTLRPLSGVLLGGVLFSSFLTPGFLEVLISLLQVNSNHILTDTSISQFLLITAGLGIGRTYLLKNKDDSLIQYTEGAICLFGITTVILINHFLFQVNFIRDLSTDSLERGILTNLFYVLGLVLFRWANTNNRKTILCGAMSLLSYAIFRTIFYDFIIFNPLLSSEKIIGFPFINSLWIVYGLPVLWSGIAIKELGKALLHSHLSKTYVFPFVLLFTFVSLLIRHLFQGPYLNGLDASMTEIYTYSAVWLACGLGLLILGTLKESRLIRLASQAVIMLTISKVFLVDAARLDGLLRVLSFLLLGGSLIGLSWFYSRFNLVKSTKNTE